MRRLAHRLNELKAAAIRRAWERVRRPLQKYLYPLDAARIRTALRDVGVERGMTLCVHSSLGRLGHVEGGADAVVDALLEEVGAEGCVVMPTFPIVRSMQELIDSGKTFDVRQTPSRMGVVTEVFRKRPDVRRSHHPTNSMAACGRGAEALLQGHELSRTPYGFATPYGRLAASSDAFVLMLETHVHSLLHHVQERAEFPTLFLPDERTVPYVDEQGRPRTMQTKVMRPRVPYFVAIPSRTGSEPDWAILHDYALIFPRHREAEVRRLGYRFAGFPAIHRRREELSRRGVLRTARLGRGEMGLLHIPSFVGLLEPEMRELIDTFRAFYDPERILARQLPYS